MSNSKALVVLSGGLDSTSALVLAMADYSEVHAITYYYGQKQSQEIEMAKRTCQQLGVKHSVVDITFLGDIAKPFSANISGSDITMPTITDVLGEPQPVTYVPNRNMILLSIAASYAEVNKIDTVICGFQSNDTYGYHDTTENFLDKINDVLHENRTWTITVRAPFVNMSKYDEITQVVRMTGSTDVFKNTLTCYNPSADSVSGEPVSCGVCPSCTERLSAFQQAGLVDPIKYAEGIV